MKYAACVLALGFLLCAAPAVGQVVYESVPTVTYYPYGAPVTTYYAPSVPTTTYYAPAPVATYYAPYTTYYAPAAVYYPANYYYVPRRVARRWYRNAYYW